MATGQLTNDTLDAFPKTVRVGAPSGPRETDVDIALKAYRDAGANGVLKFLDYNFTDEIGDDGKPTGRQIPVDEKVARARAGGRVPTLKDRGYDIASGWVIVSRNGAVYAKFYGPGAVPDEFNKQAKVGENVPV